MKNNFLYTAPKNNFTFLLTQMENKERTLIQINFRTLEKEIRFKSHF